MKVEVEKLLKDVGFPEELFILRTGTDFVCVMFDSKTSNGETIKMVINWKSYTKFYNNSYRYIDTNPFKKKQGERCRNTSMIEQAISIITGQSLLTNNYEEMVKKTIATGTMYNEERELLSRQQPQRQPQLLSQGGRNKRKTRKRRKTRKLRKRRNKRKTSKHL